ncbi:MAG TPA: DUF6512 family protein [Candidatus Bathyarchaeia archaeon]|nr:DUF6512 family protein [Candidatus Bathyarchaeia archaeon]
MDTKIVAIEDDIAKDRKLRRDIIIWEAVGWLIIFGFGNLFHFYYEWVPWKGYGWFFAINESMWEHIKLAFWPALIFYTIQYFVLRKRTEKIIVAKAIALYVGPIVMLAFYYTMVGVFGEEIKSIWLSIITFIFATVIQQLSSYALLTIKPVIDKKKQKILDIISLVVVGLLMIAMIVFTYVQPQIDLFYDTYNATYGFLPTT